MGDPAEPSPIEQPGEQAQPEPVGPRTPDKTTKELDVGWGESPHELDQHSDDERLLRERPPHWEQ